MPGPSHRHASTTITDADIGRVQVDARVDGSTMWIDRFVVPEDLRGRGVGRAAWEHFTAEYIDGDEAVREQVRLVRLVAADMGAGPSDGFWSKMGFSHRYAGQGLPSPYAHAMHLGINGRTTPRPLPWDPEAASEWD